MAKQGQRQLRAIDAIGTLREVFVPERKFSAELTARPLAGYFKEGGSALRCDPLVDYGIAMLSGHRDEKATLRELERYSYPRMQIEGAQIVRAMAAEYLGRVSACVKVPRKWVRIRNGLGVWLPAAMRLRVDGDRRFVIVQPRRTCDAVRKFPGLLTSLFKLHHAVEDDRATPTDILDLQCSKEATVRPRRIIKLDDVKQYSKQEIDVIFATYADAMLLLLKQPTQYGISEEWAKTAQIEFDFHW